VSVLCLFGFHRWEYSLSPYHEDEDVILRTCQRRGRIGCRHKPECWEKDSKHWLPVPASAFDDATDTAAD
jgi:hypothetical protein